MPKNSKVKVNVKKTNADKGKSLSPLARKAQKKRNAEYETKRMKRDKEIRAALDKLKLGDKVKVVTVKGKEIVGELTMADEMNNGEMWIEIVYRNDINDCTFTCAAHNLKSIVKVKN